MNEVRLETDKYAYAVDRLYGVSTVLDKQPPYTASLFLTGTDVVVMENLLKALEEALSHQVINEYVFEKLVNTLLHSQL